MEKQISVNQKKKKRNQKKDQDFKKSPKKLKNENTKKFLKKAAQEKDIKEVIKHSADFVSVSSQWMEQTFALFVEKKL